MLLRVMLAFESTQNLDNRLARRWIVVVLEKSLQVRHQTFRASQRKDEAYAEICARQNPLVPIVDRACHLLALSSTPL